MLNSQPDLEACAKEPIHIPGSIQSHGFLIVVDAQSLVILQSSTNISDFLPFTAADVFGKHLYELPIAGLKEIVTIYTLNNTFRNVNPITIKINRTNGPEIFNLIHHTWNGCLLLEFEPSASVHKIVESNTVLSGLITILNSSSGTVNLLEKVATHVKLISGYDKVMIYRFAEDFHGEVVAEALNENDKHSYLGLHFPASDIPVQARALYVKNKVRIIPDVWSATASLYPLLIDNQPTNLENSVLRAVSPIHIQYLKNMGVAASFSISIIIDGNLWGLIACHSYQANFIPYELRQTCEMIGFILSCHLHHQITASAEQYEKTALAHKSKMIANIKEHWSIPRGLCGTEDNMMNIADCTGAALFFNNELYTVGQTPEDDQLIELINYLHNEKSSVGFYQTNELPLVYEPAKVYADTATGLMSICLNTYLKEYLLWVKPEKKKTISWGGSPDKPVEYDQAGNLQPRSSFASWQQSVVYTSDTWSSTDITVAQKLKDDLQEIISYQANEIRLLNEKLLIANTELDAFGYTVSHDLKNPLTAIHAYSQLLAETYGGDQAAPAFVISNRILDKSRQLNQMIDDIINYTKSTRLSVVTTALNTRLIIHDIIEDFKSYSVIQPVFILNDIPSIIGNHTMIRQIFQNIISNAVKYSSGRLEGPVITIDGWKNMNDVCFSIKDNGVGFDMKDASRIFEIFSRLKPTEFSGHGVGLSIVKRLVDRLNGKIWVESEIGKGSTFFISFPAPVKL